MKESKFIFGIHPVVEALKQAESLEKIFILKTIKPEVRRQIMDLAVGRDVPVQFVPIEKLNRLTGGNHQGVVASVSPIAYSEIEPLVPWWFENGVVPFVVVLDEITDVRNLGAIARTCDAAGVHALLLPQKNSAQINSETIKASAGAIYNIPICRSKQLKKTIEFLKQSGFCVVCCTEKTNKEYHQVDYEVPLALVFGSEEYGISNDILNIADLKVKIPMHGEVGSLNVSVAAGIVMYEVVKQRG